MFVIAGGLGLLLFGMKMVSSGLEILAGDHLQSFLKRAAGNRVTAVIVGIVATVIINSSTAATIITVGFVNSGLMDLFQAIGVIMGANVGTTFSAQLIAFRIDRVAPAFILIGIIMYLFFKSRRVKNIGYAFLGFGILFFSITIMGGPLRELSRDESFRELLITFESPILALLVGFAFTAIVQSSSTTMGILVTMHLSYVPLLFRTSAFIVLGTNIGTSITTLIASLPASRDSKRAAVFHITYDIIGSVVFGTLIFLVPNILFWFEATWSEPARQVAMFHTLYNIATCLLLLPFVKLIATALQRVIPVGQAETDKAAYERKLIYLDTKTMRKPTIAVLDAHREIVRMGKIAYENLSLSIESFFERSEEKVNLVFEREKTVNYLNHNIASELVEINNMALSASDAERLGEMFRVLTDIERIGDHAENIAEYTLVVKDGNLAFSRPAVAEMELLCTYTKYIVAKALDTFETRNEANLAKIDELEDKVDELSVTFAGNHIARLKMESCQPKSGVIFTDMITDLERSADHAKNIAFSILPESKRKEHRKIHRGV
jgi:phosphate:Na+ symporter